MNYKVWISNYIECGIDLTNEPTGEYDDFNGGYSVFSTFKAAKKEYINQINSEKQRWNEVLLSAKKIRKKDVL